MEKLNMNWELLANPDYKFITENPVLGDNIILLTYGGSHAYGTNVSGSDIDIRGITFNPIESILTNTNFEQFEDKGTDTVIFGLNKMIELLLKCNPNTIECLGNKPEHYFVLSEEGKCLLENRKIFLSRRAIYTFGSYANNQLRRLQNALARDSYPQAEKEQHILGSTTHALEDIIGRYHTVNGEPIKYSFAGDHGALRHAFSEYNTKMRQMEDFKHFEYGSIELYPDVSDREEMDIEIFCDVVLHHYPLRDYRNIWNEINTIVKDYDKLGKRNTKKDDIHLNKHAQHLVRLYLMCIDILEKEEIITYREADHDLLMSIRNGEYQKSDHTYRPEFFELIDSLEKRMRYVASNNHNGKYTYLHRLIVGVNGKIYVDHIDRNRLNNTKSNLRAADGSENGMNKGIRSNNRSGKVGVHWSKSNNKWCAMICFRKKHINLGYFDNYDDAVACRVNAEKYYFREYRAKNERASINKY